MSASAIASKAHVQDVFNTKKQQQSQSSSYKAEENVSPTHPAPLSSNRYQAEDFVTKYRDLPKYEGEGKSEYSTPMGKAGSDSKHVEDVSKEKEKSGDDFDKVVEVQGKEKEEEPKKADAEEEDEDKTVIQHGKAAEEEKKAGEAEAKPAEEEKKAAEEAPKVEEKAEEKVEEPKDEEKAEEKKEEAKAEEKKEK